MVLRVRHAVLAALAVLLLAPVRVRCESVTAEEVDAAIKRGSAALLSSLSKEDMGASALTVLALLHSGIPATHPLLAEQIREIRAGVPSIGEGYQGTYYAGIVNMMFAELRDPEYTLSVEIVARKLLRMQERNGSWGDNSRTQFALLGLQAARELGVNVPSEAFARAQNFIESGQSNNGGWGYYPHAPPGYNTMTAAGLTSEYIVTADARKNCPVCGDSGHDYRLGVGLNYLGTILSIAKQRPSFHYYYLYSLERVGVLLGQKFIGGHDWYREGAEFLLKRQSSDGLWHSEAYATEFALLFLAKGRTPVVINKLDYGTDWNPDPYDASELARLSAQELNTPMAAQVIDVNSSSADLASAPILYLQGHKSFEFTPEFRQKIKAFVEQGGFIVASACCGGSAGFDASFRHEMAQIFPDSPLEPLANNHDVFSIRHVINEPQSFRLLGINVACHAAIFYAPHDVCCAWSGCTGCLDVFSVRTQARELGENIVAYALTFKELKPRLPSTIAQKRAIEATNPPPTRSALVLGQIVHDGDWNPDPLSLVKLARTLQKQTGMKNDVGRRAVVPGQTDLGEFPILYLTGHSNFNLSPSAEQALRVYLDRGGFLFCDACCGRAEFDAAFRRLCSRLSPDLPLERIVATHPILCEPYAITAVEYKPAVNRLFPDVGDKPVLEGIADSEGRLKIVYSRFNLGCELQGHSCESCLGVTAKDAYRIAVNVVMYGLSH
jgi:hypothetical protein